MIHATQVSGHEYDVVWCGVVWYVCGYGGGMGMGMGIFFFFYFFFSPPVVAVKSFVAPLPYPSCRRCGGAYLFLVFLAIFLPKSAFYTPHVMFWKGKKKTNTTTTTTTTTNAPPACLPAYLLLCSRPS
jgi:hypothetical protein